MKLRKVLPALALVGALSATTGVLADPPDRSRQEQRQQQQQEQRQSAIPGVVDEIPGLGSSDSSASSSQSSGPNEQSQSQSQEQSQCMICP